MRLRFFYNWKLKLFFGAMLILMGLAVIFKDTLTIFDVFGLLCAVISFISFGLLYIEVDERGIGCGNLCKIKKRLYCFIEWNEVEELRCWGTSRTMVVVCGNGKRIALENYSNVPKILKIILENSNPKEIDKEILQMVNK